MTKNANTDQLLKQVVSDFSLLKRDIATLLSSAGKNSLQDAAVDLARYGKTHARAGRSHAASSIKYIRQNPGRTSVGFLGGLILLAAAGAGIHYLFDAGIRNRKAFDGGIHKPKATSRDRDLPPYIS